MTRIDIFSGFLGAGKTTLIRKLINEGYKGQKLVLIENEFGEIAIDGGFLKDAGVQITEMNSGCICCTLVGDFTKALKKVMDDYAPDRIIIEPSGVGKLSDVAKAVEHVDGAHIGAKVTVVDAGKCRMYMRNFGEFFNDQVENADLIVMSRTDITPEAKVQTAADMLRTLNHDAGLITTPLDTTTTTMMTTAAAVTIMTTITRSTSIITTTTTTSAPAAATITIMSTTITTMLTRSSPAGAWRRRASSLRRALRRSSKPSMRAPSTALSCAPRA